MCTHNLYYSHNVLVIRHYYSHCGLCSSGIRYLDINNIYQFYYFNKKTENRCDHNIL